MSDETTSGDEEPIPQPKPASKVRRISNKPVRKAAKKAAAPAAVEEKIPTEEFQSEPSSSENEPVSSEESKEETKKKSRRRRGKGKSGSKDANSADSDSDEDRETSSTEETIAFVEEKQDSPSSRQDRHERPQHQNQQRPPQKQRTRLDPEKVAKKAWKIYLAEVSEEGVALIGDHDARELSRRCFRLAEIFLEETERRS